MVIGDPSPLGFTNRHAKLSSPLRIAVFAGSPTKKAAKQCSATLKKLED